jgi:endoglucanase
LNDALTTIREDNPERIVLIGTAEWGGLGGLPSLELPEDENIILTVHYYNPFQFTHQGAEWSGEQSQAWLGTKWLDTETERDVMRQDFAPLKAYELQNNIPIHIGEFGAYSKADLQSRVKWTTFLSRYLEELGWSWAYWEFSAGFGIYNPSTKALLQPLVDALLHNEMPEPGRYVGTPIYTSNFQTTNDGWSMNSQQGGAAQIVRSDNTITANITSGGTQGWHVQLVKGNISLQQGKKYRFSFRAKAEEARSATVYIGMSRDPWSAYSGYNGVSLADTFAVYTYVFDMGATDNAARMVFDLGISTADFSITDIMIEEIVFEPPTSVYIPQAGILDIYPNPVKERLFLKNAVGVEKVSVYNLQGKALLEKSVQHSEMSIDVSGLPPGIYLIRTEGKGTPVTRKIIKQ